MKKILLAAALLAGGSLLLQDVSIGHGGTYRGPGDTVPPGGGGGGGGGGGPAGPAGPAGPSGPTNQGPGAAGPVTGAPATGGTAQTPTTQGPTTGMAPMLGPDLTLWSFWWEFNKDPYLSLKASIHAGETTTGTTDFFLGRGEQSQSKDSYRPSESQIRDQIVPALLAALEKENNNDIVTGCLIALAKIGDRASESGQSQFEQVIKKFLADGNQEISETAALALGILANDLSVPALRDLLTDTAAGRKLVGKNEVDFRTRSFAAYGLALIGYKSASEDVRREIVTALAETLDSVESSTHDLKVACMIGLGLVTLDTLGDSAVDAEGKPLPPAANRRAQIDYVLRYFENSDNHYFVRAHAPAAAVRLMNGPRPASGSALPPDLYAAYKLRLADQLVERVGKRTKERVEVVQSAVLALGMLGDSDADELDKRIRKALADVVEDVSDLQAKNFSRIALGQVGGRAGTNEPWSGIGDVSSELEKTVARGNNAGRRWSGLGIGIMGRLMSEDNQVPPTGLGKVLRSELEKAKSPEDVGAYCIAVGILKDQEAKKIVMEKLDKLSQDEPRGYAAVALGLMNDRESIARIQDIVRESKYRPDLLKQAAIALGLLGDKDLVPDLVEMLKEAKSLASQASISTALGFIGDSRSVEPLIRMLQDKSLTERARGFAAVALGIVADKEPLPWNSKIAVDINYRASTRTLNDADGGTGVLNIL